MSDCGDGRLGRGSAPPRLFRRDISVGASHPQHTLWAPIRIHSSKQADPSSINFLTSRGCPPAKEKILRMNWRRERNWVRTFSANSINVILSASDASCSKLRTVEQSCSTRTLPFCGTWRSRVRTVDPRPSEIIMGSEHTSSRRADYIGRFFAITEGVLIREGYEYHFSDQADFSCQSHQKRHGSPKLRPVPSPIHNDIHYSTFLM